MFAELGNTFRMARLFTAIPVAMAAIAQHLVKNLKGRLSFI